MKTIGRIAALAAAIIVPLGCEDITNPVEEFGTLEDPYVRFEESSAIGPPGSYNLVIFQLPTRVEEDVTVQYTFGGDAVFGEDYQIVSLADSTVRSDVTASGGTALIPFDPEQTTFARDSILVFIPFAATVGRLLEITIASATSESGLVLETGFIENYRTFDLIIGVPSAAAFPKSPVRWPVSITKPTPPTEIAMACRMISCSLIIPAMRRSLAFPSRGYSA